MEDKPNIPGLTQETEQQSIQRRANRPRRQPGGEPDDQHSDEMRAALPEGASDAIATATNQLAPITVLDNGDDGIIIEAGESTRQSLEQQLAAGNAQLKDFKAFQEATKSLTGSTEDTSAGPLAKGLMHAACEEKQADVRMVKTEIGQIQRERVQTQTTLETLEDQLSELRKDRVFKACKKQQRKWWHRFCLCGGVEKNNKVGVAPDENYQTQDWENHFADQLAKQGSTIRSLQKDKAILERQIFKLKDGSEAANMMVKEMAQKNKEMAKGKKDMEKEKKQAEKEKKKAEGEKAKAEREKVKAEKEKEKAEKLMKEMEKKMKLEEKKREYVERLNQVLLEKLCHMKQDIDQKTDDIALNTRMMALQTEQINQLSQLKEINDKLQKITDLRFLREAKTNVDRVVIACLYFYSPQQLAIHDLMSFNQSSASGQTILDLVGKGGYGEVMLGRLNGEKDPVAIKRALVKQNLMAELEESDRERRNVRFEKEARAGLLMSTSPYFPRFLGIVMINGDQCLVTEFIGDKIQGKSYMLVDAINPRKGCDPVPDVQKWNLVAIGEDIIRGVMALHDRSLLHNDIKDDNVLLEFRKNRWVAVIIDLGMLSTATSPNFSGSNEFMSTHAKGYFIHTAPEVLNGCETSMASDVYSVGIILDCIGRFINDDGLCTLGDMCCKEDPKERPGDMEEMLPGVVDIKEKYRTVARLAGELLEVDTGEEQEEQEEEEEEEDFLTDLSETGEEEEAVGEMEEGVADEDRGEAREHQEVGDEAEDGEREEGNEAEDVEAEQGDVGEGVAGEEAPQVHHQGEIAVNDGMRNEEGLELAEAVHPNAGEAEQGGEELMLEGGGVGVDEEGGEINDGEVVEEDDGVG